MQCGTPVELSIQAATGSQPNLEFLRPSIAGGLLLGLLSSLPYVESANLIFGVWVLAGGAFSAHLLMKQRRSGISYGDGAFGGVLSGFFGAVVATLMLIPSKLLFVADWEAGRQQAELQLSKTPDVTGPLSDLFLRALSPEISLPTELFWFFMYGIFFSLFAMCGGLLMVWLAKKRKKKTSPARP
jgi:hypothetical protein